MTRPAKGPNWATDAAFPAGTDPWSGQPNKSEPSAGKKGTGFVPATDLAAEEENWLHGNHGDWNKYADDAISGSDLVVADDFVGSLISTALWTVAGGIAINDDSANGSMGAAKFATAGASGGYLLVGQNLAIGAADFRIMARMRLSLASGGSSCEFGIGSATAAENCTFYCTDATAWQCNVGNVLNPTAPSVARNATYKVFEIVRQSGVVYFYVDGVQVYTQAFATNIATGALKFNLTSGAGGDNAWLDAIKLWVDR